MQLSRRLTRLAVFVAAAAGLVVGALVWLIGLLGVPVLARAALSALPLLGAWSLLALRERAGFRALRSGK